MVIKVIYVHDFGCFFLFIMLNLYCFSIGCFFLFIMLNLYCFSIGCYFLFIMLNLYCFSIGCFLFISCFSIGGFLNLYCFMLNFLPVTSNRISISTKQTLVPPVASTLKYNRIFSPYNYYAWHPAYHANDGHKSLYKCHHDVDLTQNGCVDSSCISTWILHWGVEYLIVLSRVYFRLLTWAIKWVGTDSKEPLSTCYHMVDISLYFIA